MVVSEQWDLLDMWKDFVDFPRRCLPRFMVDGGNQGLWPTSEKWQANLDKDCSVARPPTSCFCDLDLSGRDGQDRGKEKQVTG